jgi:hypothetical protein
MSSDEPREAEPTRLLEERPCDMCGRPATAAVTVGPSTVLVCDEHECRRRLDDFQLLLDGDPSTT